LHRVSHRLCQDVRVLLEIQQQPELTDKILARVEEIQTQVREVKLAVGHQTQLQKLRLKQLTMA